MNPTLHFSFPRRASLATAVLLPVAVSACGGVTAEQALPPCDPDNGGIALPDGFCALVVADEIGPARHLAVATNGDIFVAIRGRREGGGGVRALRDTTGDGKSDIQVTFGDAGATGLSLHGEQLYVAPDWGVLRYRIPEGQLTPADPPDTIVSGLPGPGTQHAAKSAVVDDAGLLYVNIGAPSNSCQTQDRAVESPGQDLCPLLENRAGIWRFDASRVGQTQTDGVRFATGLRNTFALAMNPQTGILYGTQHGRDQLRQSWPNLFDELQGAEKPAEEFVEIQQGDDFGWPYCYFDPELGKKVLSPEYGGDGQEVGRCAEIEAPLVALPAHWAPEAVLFYTGNQFPEKYQDGAFVSFHGSWNRAPRPQAGYNVVFIPFVDGAPSGEWEVFADDFAGAQKDPRNAEHRPTGLALGPDGSLYVTDDRGGRIWRIVYKG